MQSKILAQLDDLDEDDKAVLVAKLLPGLTPHARAETVARAQALGTSGKPQRAGEATRDEHEIELLHNAITHRLGAIYNGPGWRFRTLASVQPGLRTRMLRVGDSYLAQVKSWFPHFDRAQRRAAANLILDIVFNELREACLNELTGECAVTYRDALEGLAQIDQVLHRQTPGHVQSGLFIEMIAARVQGRPLSLGGISQAAGERAGAAARPRPALRIASGGPDGPVAPAPPGGGHG